MCWSLETIMKKKFIKEKILHQEKQIANCKTTEQQQTANQDEKCS